jgi:hypothetical protein
MIDMDYLYAHHAVGLCPEERCVTARANLAALVEAAQAFVSSRGYDRVLNEHALRLAVFAVNGAALLDRVASREGSGTP